MLDAASAFLIAAGAGVIDQDSAHQTRRNAEKMGTVLPSDLSRVEKTKERFVHKRRWLERVIFPFPPYIATGQTAQLSLNERREPF